MTASATRVLMIGLDAADPSLVERWISDGSLPNLASLAARGVSGRLASSAALLAGSPWPTFYTSTGPAAHGIYHDAQWRHEEMCFASPAGGWLPARPFWRELEDGIDVIALDVPFLTTLEAFSGVEIANWGVHDKLIPTGSHPAGLLDEVRRRFGEWPMSRETFGRAPLQELLELRDHLLGNTRRTTELARWLLQRPWNLAIVVLSALHRGGHRLWDPSSVEGDVPESARDRFDGALRDLYVECDGAVGQLHAAAPDATIVAFSVHGMGPNTSRQDLMEGMLARVLVDGRGDARSRRGWLRLVGEALPLRVRRALTQRLPAGMRDRIMTRWQTGGIDWSRTPAFCPRMDLQGYVRLNVAGREVEGIVPAAEYGSLCDRIAEGLGSFRDVDTDETFVAEVHRIDRVYPRGERRHRLPDLIVRWKDTPGATHRAVHAPRFGVMQRATPGRIPGGRSGNHRGEGFLIATGAGLPQGIRLPAGAAIEDLAPSVLGLLGARARVPLAGTPIGAFAAGGTAGAA